MERLLEHPRHIEVQILGDSFGSIVHLGERDCSIQKASHQKLIEESPRPAPFRCVTRELHEMALSAARAVNYTTAGTLEFLVSGDDVYFMEMNTRIQVEHPVTEMLYGVDLVAEQIRIAAGEPMSFTQADLVPRGHAIECRINAENAAENFSPSAGLLDEVISRAAPGSASMGSPARAIRYRRITTRCWPRSWSTPPIAMPPWRAWTRRCAIRGSPGLSSTIDVCRRIIADPGFRAGGVPVDYLPALMELRR